MELHHADQLDAILHQIKQIEDHEDSLIQQGLVLGYSVPKQLNFVHLDQGTQREAPRSKAELNAELTGEQQDIPYALVLPLGAAMSVDIPVDPEQSVSGSNDGIDLENGRVSVDEAWFSPTKRAANRNVSASILSGRRYLSIEKRRQQFQRHRRLVESSLAGTGMDQCAVIEM